MQVAIQEDVMSDEIKNTKDEATTEQPATELSESALEQVAGGATNTTPKLFVSCANGKHIAKATITVR
jgi:type VI protein secretion system component Hcp